MQAYRTTLAVYKVARQGISLACSGLSREPSNSNVARSSVGHWASNAARLFWVLIYNMGLFPYLKIAVSYVEQLHSMLHDISYLMI